MGWLTDWLTLGSNQRLRNGQVLSSTHEAFSLPTTSPVHPDAFNPDMLNTPDPDSVTTPTYTYPPPRGQTYGYVPTSAGLRSRPTSLLPIHHDPMHVSLSTPNYPPLSRTWNRIRTWLGREYPELADTLNYGILPQDLANIEMQFGFTLPQAVRESYLIVDGQEPESAAGCSDGLFFGLTMLPLEDVFEEWRFWREVDDDPLTGANPQLQDAMQSYPPGWIRKEYSQRGWIPLVADKAGNYVGIDLNPDEGGSVGQVIVFGRDFDTKVVLWRGDGQAGWATWLASFAEELESGEGYEIGAGNDASDGSEDGVGYDSYFHDGNARGQGEGGGESGHGGLRLTGDYRGWSTLDAWADRSLRKWYEVGAIPESSIEPLERTKKAENVGLGVLGMGNQELDTKVVTPPPEPALASSTSENHSNSSHRSRLPSISVTKPPAPLPVELPTPYDFSPSTTRNPLFDEDLESGNSVGMREVTRDQETALVLQRRPPHSDALESTGSKSSSPRPSLLVKLNPEDRSPPLETSEVQDLLADSDLALETEPIEPTSPVTPKASDHVLAAKASVTDNSSSEALQDGASPSPDPNVTIRLVGGGGIAGTSAKAPPDLINQADDSPEPDADSAGDTDASASSVASPAPVHASSWKSGKTHQRTKSGLAGLKKLGQLGGLRKKEPGDDGLANAMN